MASPDFTGKEKQFLNAALESGQISGSGYFVDAFEEALTGMFKMKVALTSSGTSALHLLLEAHEIGPGDEVIVPSSTFVATANAVLYCGAIPRFADVDEKTWNISVESISKLINIKTKAIIVTHLYGLPVEMDSIIELAHKNHILIFEDAAEAIGAKYKKNLVGTLADGAIFSLYGNKTITSGEGGFIVTPSEKIYKLVQEMKSQGRQLVKFEHQTLGYNYRITNLSAAVGLAQFERLPDFLSRRKEVFLNYNNRFNFNGYASQDVESQDATSGYWMYGLLFETPDMKMKIESKLAGSGIESRPFFKPLNMISYFNSKDVTPNAINIWENGLCLPTHTSLTINDQDGICDVVNSQAQHKAGE